MKKRFFAGISIIAILLSFMCIPTFAGDDSEFVEKVYCSATIEDSFVDDEVIIVVMPYANHVEYTPADFDEVDCVAIKEIAGATDDGTLGRIIKLSLRDKSKANVLQAISALENREDIYSAEPNYLMKLASEPDDPAYVSDDQWGIDKIQLP